MNIHFKFLCFALFCSTLAVGQKGEWYTIKHNGGLCTSSIVLFKDGSYNYEGGCETSSHFCFGTWIQKKDTILFTQADRQKFTVIKNIRFLKVNDSTTLTVKLLDLDGNNITDRIRVGQYVSGAGTYPMELDSTKEKQVVYRRTNGIIVLTSLQKLFKQRLAVPIDSSNYFEITLNLPSYWIYHPNSD